MNFDSLAKILKGTKRKKKDINLLEVSKELKNLYESYNSLDRVAKVVKLSPEMVREFLKKRGRCVQKCKF
jgi:predicted HTH domain antitoxin